MMNFNGKRIVEYFSLLTGIQIKETLKILSKSKVFLEVVHGNPAYNYEGYISNLFDIKDELKERPDCPKEIDKISEMSVVLLNELKIKNAREHSLRSRIKDFFILQRFSKQLGC
jgi:hypothetical protein